MSLFESGPGLLGDLCIAMDDAVEELLEQFGVEAPPVDAVWLGRKMGLEPLRCRPRAVRRRRVPGRVRQAWASERWGRQREAARSIIRGLVGGICRRVGIEGQDGVAGVRARFAALWVPRLLLPLSWFREDVRRLGCDLAQLHRRYCTASMESAGWRLLDLGEPMMVALFDNNWVVDRRSNVSCGIVEAHSAAELAAQTYAHTYSRPGVERGPGVTARAWPVHQADWRREIVVSVFDADFAAAENSGKV